MKIKKIALLFSVIMAGATAPLSYATEDLGNQRLDINNVLKSGDIYDNKVSDEIVIKEVVTKVYENGTFETQPIGEMLDNNTAYSRIELETEDGESLTVYLRNELGGELGEKDEYIEKIAVGDVIQASIEDDDGVELTTLEVIVANNAEGSFMTKHINIVNFD